MVKQDLKSTRQKETTRINTLSNTSEESFE